MPLCLDVTSEPRSDNAFKPAIVAPDCFDVSWLSTDGLLLTSSRNLYKTGKLPSGRLIPCNDSLYGQLRIMLI